MLVTLGEILDRANCGGFAVPAPNVFYDLDARACIEAAEERRSPLILDVAPKAVPDLVGLGGILTALAAKASVPVAVHLDHGSSFQEVIQAVRGGFTSVMIDCSSLSYAENTARVREVVEAVRPLGISVEAELGHVGQGASYDGQRSLTDPEEARRFMEETGISALAVAIGTAHGTYAGEPKLDFDRLCRIKELTRFPLVLHGSSGTGKDNIAKACRMGINKVNVCIDILHSVSRALQSADLSGNSAYQVWEIARTAVRTAAAEQMDLTGSAGKAWIPVPTGLTTVKTSMEE